jgi:hypothetical protein
MRAYPDPRGKCNSGQDKKYCKLRKLLKLPAAGKTYTFTKNVFVPEIRNKLLIFSFSRALFFII